MKCAAKAKQLGMKQDTLKRKALEYGGVKVGGQWIFPDTVESSAEEAEDFEYPDIDHSEKVLKYHQSMKMKEEHLKIKNANAVASGQFVDRNQLENQWKQQAIFIKSKVLSLPGLLKNRMADELTDRSEQVLEDLCHEILTDMAEGYQQT